jgi:hypothetical protein
LRSTEHSPQNRPDAHREPTRGPRRPRGAVHRPSAGPAARVVADVVAYFAETPTDFVRRRHGELQRTGLTNERIFAVLADEMGTRRFAPPDLSPRQLRRLVYG